MRCCRGGGLLPLHRSSRSEKFLRSFWWSFRGFWGLMDHHPRSTHLVSSWFLLTWFPRYPPLGLLPPLIFFFWKIFRKQREYVEKVNKLKWNNMEINIQLFTCMLMFCVVIIFVHAWVFVCIYMRTYYMCTMKKIRRWLTILDSTEECELCSKNEDIDQNL